MQCSPIRQDRRREVADGFRSYIGEINRASRPGAEKQIRSMHIFQHAYLVQLERIEKLRKLEAQMPVIMTLTQT